MTIVACAVLVIGIFVYIFYPQRNTEVQTQKTRLEFLRERRFHIARCMPPPRPLWSASPRPYMRKPASMGCR